MVTNDGWSCDKLGISAWLVLNGVHHPIVLEIFIKDSTTTAVTLNEEFLFLLLPVIRDGLAKVVGFIADGIALNKLFARV